MLYQLAMFHPGGESWNLYREDYEIVAFDSLTAAEARASELSATYAGREILVLTLHGCFKTTTVYPKSPAVVTTERIPIPSKMKPSSPSDAL